MTQIRVDAARLRDLTLAVVRALEEVPEVEIDAVTLNDLHRIVEDYHPEDLVRMHLFDFLGEVIDDSDI